MAEKILVCQVCGRADTYVTGVECDYCGSYGSFQRMTREEYRKSNHFEHSRLMHSLIAKMCILLYLDCSVSVCSEIYKLIDLRARGPPLCSNLFR